MRDELDQRNYEDHFELVDKYFVSKFEYYMREKLNQIKLTQKDLEERYEERKIVDERIKRRADFMYNYGDYDSDRTKIRKRFIEEMNKKTTLKDIGD